MPSHTVSISLSLGLRCALLELNDRNEAQNSPATEVGNPASLDKALLIITLWDICNNIQVGVEFLPLGN